MKFGIQTWGSTGDIRPFIALATGLQAAGHDVTLYATDIDNRDYSEFAEKAGFAINHIATPVIEDPAELDRIGLACINAGNPLVQAKIIINEMFLPVIEEMYEAALELCQNSDVVIRHFFLHPTQIAAEKFNVPEITVQMAHYTLPSRHLPAPGLPNLGKWFYPFGWWLNRTALNTLFMPAINRMRGREGLPPAADLTTKVWSSGLLNLFAVSPSICLRPVDWEPRHQICGFLSIPDSSLSDELPPSISQFLDEGDKPIFITFGSLMPKSTGYFYEAIDLFRKAAQRANCRAIIQVPGDTIAALPVDRHIFYTATINHKIIFPRCALVVHHGGAGTSHSTLLAGVPSVVVAHAADQFFWASELQRLGVAPKILRIKSLTAENLASRIGAVLHSPAMKDNARRISAAMKDEDGVAKAVELVEKFLTTTKTQRSQSLIKRKPRFHI